MISSDSSSALEFKDQYKVLWRVSSARVNTVYVCNDRLLRRRVIVKIFEDKSKIKRCYKAFLCLKDSALIPNILDKGDYGDKTYLVFDHRGTSLLDLWDMNDKNLNNENVAMVALKMLKILKTIHGKGIIHGNLDPGKILIDHSEKHYFSLADFSFHAKPKKADDITIKLNHYPPTRKFSSINCHMKRALDKMDDLESLGYILYHFCSEGKFLDFDKNNLSDDEKLARYLESKMSIKSQYKDMPKSLHTYFSYLETLKEGERPNYDALKTIFKKWLRELNPFLKFNFVWNTLSDERPYQKPELIKINSEGANKPMLISKGSMPVYGNDLDKKAAEMGFLPYSPTMVDLVITTPTSSNDNNELDDLDNNSDEDSSDIQRKMVLLNRSQSRRSTLKDLNHGMIGNPEVHQWYNYSYPVHKISGILSQSQQLQEFSSPSYIRKCLG
eukprot:TRINITY_DN5444_c0_g1_i14.p1 TRINITY_DN5444_c0_g1~~TRINITY_DN5444_c0_g1_i14.p1  ORF type:complete len:443 (-),score=37.41 TRINITY_DN5444_c0_g1_i14:212-1540(-)